MPKILNHPAPSQRVAPSWRRRLRYLYMRFLRLRGSPEELSRGLAVGVFAGWFPLFGLQILIGVALATLIRGSKIMAAGGTWVSNPLTYVPIYAFNYHVGRVLLGEPPVQTFSDLESFKSWMTMGSDIILALFLGCTVVGLICSLITYSISLPLIKSIRARRRLKMSLRRLRSVRE